MSFSQARPGVIVEKRYISNSRTQPGVIQSVQFSKKRDWKGLFIIITNYFHEIWENIYYVGKKSNCIICNCGEISIHSEIRKKNTALFKMYVVYKEIKEVQEVKQKFRRSFYLSNGHNKINDKVVR